MNAKTALLTVVLALVSAVAGAAPLGTAGIGVVLADSEQGPQIGAVLPDSPAAKANLTAGLIITKVDRTPTAELTMEECVRLIRGAPGAPVFIEVTNTLDGTTRRILLLRMPLPVEE